MRAAADREDPACDGLLPFWLWPNSAFRWPSTLWRKELRTRKGSEWDKRGQLGLHKASHDGMNVVVPGKSFDPVRAWSPRARITSTSNRPFRSHRASCTSPKAGAAKTCLPTSWPGPRPSTKSANPPPAGSAVTRVNPTHLMANVGKRDQFQIRDTSKSRSSERERERKKTSRHKVSKRQARPSQVRVN